MTLSITELVSIALHTEREIDPSASEAAAARAVTAALRAITHALRRGEEVHLRGFGRFVVVETPPRSGRYPRPATRRVRFRASTKLI